MPNDCTSIITITCDDEDLLTKFVENDLQSMECMCS